MDHQAIRDLRRRDLVHPLGTGDVRLTFHYNVTVPHREYEPIQLRGHAGFCNLVKPRSPSGERASKLGW